MKKLIKVSGPGYSKNWQLRLTIKIWSYYPRLDPKYVWLASQVISEARVSYIGLPIVEYVS